MPPRYTNAGINVTQDTLAQLEAQAKEQGTDKSALGRSIIEAHLAGESAAAVRKELSDLAAAFGELRERFEHGGGGYDSGQLVRLEDRFESLEDKLGLLAAAVHNALRVIVYQQLEPSPAQTTELEAQLQALQTHYRKTP